VADFRFLKSITNQVPKVTIPSPTMLHFRGGRAAISKAYPDMEGFYADVAPCYRAELKLGETGTTYQPTRRHQTGTLIPKCARVHGSVAMIPMNFRAAMRG
jgi:hypothetical protein